MATIRPFSPLTPSSLPARPAQAEVGAAQRAFFQAALTGAAPPEGAPAPARPPAVRPTPITTDAEPPARSLRPGSLLDIRV